MSLVAQEATWQSMPEHTLARDDGFRICVSLDYVAYNSFTDLLSKHLRDTYFFL